LDSLWKQTMRVGVSCVVEVDIRKFFDTLDHAHLRTFLQQRIRDGVVLRRIGKRLNAGVMEDGAVTHPDTGSPQGGGISPVRANVYLHYVLDQGFAREVQPRLRGRAYLVRKPQGDRTPSDGSGPGTFDFLGFTHYWARSRKGNWIVKRKTASSRFTRAIRTISPWCRSHRHDPMAEQHATLCQKLRGHAAYYGITGNSPALSRFRYEALRVWRKWLMRRRRAWRASWTWFGQLLTRYPVPYLHAVHSVCRGVANG
jgi:hypothetical protein